jgi:hypothetical protein
MSVLRAARTGSCKYLPTRTAWAIRKVSTAQGATTAGWPSLPGPAESPAARLRSASGSIIRASASAAGSMASAQSDFASGAIAASISSSASAGATNPLRPKCCSTRFETSLEPGQRSAQPAQRCRLEWQGLSGRWRRSHQRGHEAEAYDALNPHSRPCGYQRWPGKAIQALVGVSSCPICSKLRTSLLAPAAQPVSNIRHAAGGGAFVPRFRLLLWCR